ncbi:lipocalin/fatty acid-binding family protein [Marinilabilia rubra]|uniref:Cell surface protein n=1 Tax=Marinilabilia rubra TaxID=2162893 RepID=A0A2U2B607_9BACT|nr:hypothetical protein [Marinilabilia rubra]PWD98510.1 hypothetical protein DDZ16_14825 [Marinilabilia rubra]
MKKRILAAFAGAIGFLWLFQSCSTEDPAYPVYQDLVTEVATVDFDPTILDASSSANYRIAGTKLTGSVSVNVSGSAFSVSKTSTGEFSNSLEIQPDEFVDGLFNVYVKFMPNELGNFEGAIEHSTSGVVSMPTVQLSGQGITDPGQIAKLLMSDDFDYAVGELPSTDRTGDGLQNALMEDWIKIRTANTPIDVIAPGLEYPGYPGSGIGNAVDMKFTPPGSNSNLYAYNLSEQQDEEFTGSYYVSCMFKVEGYPAEGQFNRPVMFIDWVEANGAGDFSSAIQVANNGGDVKFGIKWGPDGALSDVTPEIGKTYLIVLKHTVTDTDPDNVNNTASLYIFEDGVIPSQEPAEGALTNVKPDSWGDKMIKAISLLRDNSGPGDYVVDGLRVANTWEDLFK